MIDSEAAKLNLERYRKYRRMARSETDVDRRAELRIRARQYLQHAAEADPVFVARASAEAAASLLARISQRTAMTGTTHSHAGQVIRPSIRAWNQAPRLKVF
jgi:hypothetical protein